jgi:hypothetical protein
MTWSLVRGTRRKLVRAQVEYSLALVRLKGEMGTGDSPYLNDVISVPFENPWNSWMRLGGFDFIDDDTAVVATWQGDTWIVEGIGGGAESGSGSNDGCAGGPLSGRPVPHPVTNALNTNRADRLRTGA